MRATTQGLSLIHILAQRLDDGADEQAGEQALCHRDQRLDEVALGGDDDVLALSLIHI